MIHLGMAGMGGMLIGCGIAWLLIGIFDDYWFAFKWSFAWTLPGIAIVLFDYLLIA